MEYLSTIQETMSSLQIAELTGKRHSNVIRDIRNILEQLEDRGAFKFELSSYKSEQNKDIPCYILTKKDCLLLASGYDANLRAKIVNRWEELETEKRKGGFEIPSTLSQALLLAARQAEKIEEQQKALAVKQEEIDTVTAENRALKQDSDYLNDILRSRSTVTITQIANDYGMSAKAFNRKLNEMHIQHKVSGQWILYAPYLANGYVHSETVDIIHSDGRRSVKMNTRWTQRGRLFLYNALKEVGVLPLIEQEVMLA